MGGQKGEKLKVPQAGREGRLGKAAGGPDENKVGTRAARLPSTAGETGKPELRPALEAGCCRGCPGWRDGVAEPGCSRAAAGAAGHPSRAPRGSAALGGDGRCAELLGNNAAPLGCRRLFSYDVSIVL